MSVFETFLSLWVALAIAAGVALGLGYNRRFHPEMTKLRDRIRSGDLGVVMHVEATMTFPNALLLKADAWRAQKDETPCGGLTPMGVHAIDGMIDLCGPIDSVFCQSFRRAVAIDADDTTTMLFRMKEGMSGYLGTMTATGPGFSFTVYGSKGSVRLEGNSNILLVDFDVAQSFGHQAGGSGRWVMHPVVMATDFQARLTSAGEHQPQVTLVVEVAIEAPRAEVAVGDDEHGLVVSQQSREFLVKKLSGSLARAYVART